MTKTWHILLPGPSLSKLTVRPEGPVVSVNKAICHEIQPDYFCALDSPLSLGAEADQGSWNWSMWDRLQRLRPWVWTDPLNFKLWHKYGYPQTEGWKWDASGIPWWPAPSKKTVFYAIQGAVLRGAKSIHLWGCDMEGDNYFDGPAKGAWGDSRWKTEALKLYRVIDAAKEAGVTIARR